MIKRKVNAFFNPEQFQGWGKKRNYFEGWYYKLVNADESKAVAIIPGIAMDRQGNAQSFIQVLDGKRKTALYHKFAAAEFVAQPGKFFISIGNNSFSSTGLEVNLPGLQGGLQFSGNIVWPKPFYSPGIMGPYSFAPFMECKHGIVSMDHSITGSLTIQNDTVSFAGGRGYIEKDWGRSFPSAYCWLQSNHFSVSGISLKISVAKIPWVSNSFTGFIGGLWLHNKLYRFTTYNRTRLLKCTINQSNVEIVMENSNNRIEILAHRDAATELASPIGGLMDGRVEESMTATVDLQLTDKKNKVVLLNDTGRNTGLEVAGIIKDIMV